MSESTAPPSPALSARTLVRSCDSGILSTQSSELSGYPFGSVTPYVMAHAGHVAIYVSGIAEHTANMRADPKVCLTVTEQGADNQQALGRVSLVGDAEPVPASSLDEVQARYFALFPGAREYGSAHSFEFFWIVPKRARYIAGFGRIHWVEAQDWSPPPVAWAGKETVVIQHMNDDHAGSVSSIAERGGARDGSKARMVAVDVEGCHIQAGEQRIYASFSAPACSENELRQRMIELSRSS